MNTWATPPHRTAMTIAKFAGASLQSTEKGKAIPIEEAINVVEVIRTGDVVVATTTTPITIGSRFEEAPLREATDKVVVATITTNATGKTSQAHATVAVDTATGPMNARLNASPVTRSDKLSKSIVLAVELPKTVTKTVKGSLKNHQQWWIEHEKNWHILRIIDHGYQLPFTRIPEKTFLKNNLSSRIESDFVISAIEDLLHSGAVVEVKDPPLIINPLTVAHNKTKKRLVLDCREINPCLKKEAIKYEDITFASTLLKKRPVFLRF
jgi:hypothetical protein